MIQTIVFDFGNVIGFFDFRRNLERLTEHSDLSLAEMRAVFYDSPLEDDYEAGRLSTDDYLTQILRMGCLRCSREQLADLYADVFWPNQAVCDLLAGLKSRYRLLLGSNTNELHSGQFRRQFAGHLSHFDHLVLSHEIGVRKPNADFFHECHKHAGCAPGECVFIDDLPDNVAGAKALGWHGIVYSGLDDLRRQMTALGITI